MGEVPPTIIKGSISLIQSFAPNTNGEISSLYVKEAKVSLLGHQLMSTESEEGGEFSLALSDGFLKEKYSLSPKDKEIPLKLLAQYWIDELEFGILSHQILAKRGKTIDIGDLSMIATGGLKGQVLLSDGGEVGHIDVYVKGTSVITQCDSHGNFTIPSLVEGVWEMGFRAPNYGEVILKGVKTESGVLQKLDPVTLFPKERVDGFIIVKGNKAWLSEKTVNVRIQYSKAVKLIRWSAKGTFEGIEWQPTDLISKHQGVINFATTFTEDGEKEIVVQFSDGFYTEVQKVVSFIIDTSPPKMATHLEWSGSHKNHIVAKWKRSSSIDLLNQKIQFFKGEECETPLNLIDLQSAEVESKSLDLVQSGVYTYQVLSVDHDGLETLSLCSDPISSSYDWRVTPLVSGKKENHLEVSTLIDHEKNIMTLVPEQEGHIHFYKWDGVKWQADETLSLPTSSLSEIDSHMAAGQIFVATLDESQKASVYARGGEGFELLGDNNFTEGPVMGIEVAVAGETPLLVYQDATQNKQLVSKVWRNQAWENEDSLGVINSNNYQLFKGLNQESWLVYLDANNTEELKSLQYSGSEWAASHSFASPLLEVKGFDLLKSSKGIYLLALKEENEKSKAEIYSLGESSWDTQVVGLLSSPFGRSPSVYLNEDVFYLAYIAGNTEQSLVVFKWQDSSWQPLEDLPSLNSLSLARIYGKGSELSIFTWGKNEQLEESGNLIEYAKFMTSLPKSP